MNKLELVTAIVHGINENRKIDDPDQSSYHILLSFQYHGEKIPVFRKSFDNEEEFVHFKNELVKLLDL